MASPSRTPGIQEHPTVEVRGGPHMRAVPHFYTSVDNLGTSAWPKAEVVRSLMAAVRNIWCPGAANPSIHVGPVFGGLGQSYRRYSTTLPW